MYKSKILKVSLLFLVFTFAVSFSLFGCKEEATPVEEEAAPAEEVEEVTEKEAAEEEAVELSTEPVTLNITIEQSSGECNEIYNAIVEEFMELYPNVTIKQQVYKGDELGTKIRTAITAGEPLDGFMMICSDVVWFAENEVLAEIDPSIFGMTIEEYVNQWLPASFETSNALYNGKYVGIPFCVSNFAGFINTAHMKAAGLDPESDIPTTWTEAREVAKKMTIVEDGVTVQDGFYQFIGSVEDVYILSSMFQQKGLDWLSLEGMIAGCDTPEAVEVLKMYTDVVLVDKSMDPATFDPQFSPLADGTASMFFWGGPWMFGLIEAGGGNPDDYRAIKYPRFADGLDKGGETDGYGLFITETSENKEWTLKFFDFWTSRPELFVDVGLYLPRADFDADAAFGDTVPNWEVFVEEFPKATPFIADTRSAEIIDAIIKTETRVIYEGITAEESIAMLKADLETIQNQ